jgi:hypothetical protein
MALILNSPKQLEKPATKLQVSGVLITDSNITISYQWLDQTGNNIISDSIILTGQDFLNIVNVQVQATHVGLTFGRLLKRLAYNRLKNMLSLIGTVEE